MIPRFAQRTIAGPVSRPPTYVPPKSTATLTRSVPGVTPSTVPSVNVAAQQVANRPQVSTPYEAFQANVRQQLEKSKQHTQDIQRRALIRKAMTQTAAKYQSQWNSANPGSFTPTPAGGVGGGQYRNTQGFGAWGGFANGNIPLSALAPIGGGHYMRKDAAQAFVALNAAFRRQFGRNISITDSYRPYSVQVRLKRQKPSLAATPGKSNHGWGLALDLGGGINRWGTTESNWMVRNARKFGFVAPISYEAWHWEFRG